MKVGPWGLEEDFQRAVVISQDEARAAKQTGYDWIWKKYVLEIVNRNSENHKREGFSKLFPSIDWGPSYKILRICKLRL